ncbi:fumarylacetoacetate hydrolase family protein [Streptomyces sp. SHP 1-2]|uniref:fumarylacetoacetate hydrolase family protein n=1 Tax=Streptomyces sp. SHP 1-2 TaxID=2769489 RepID=UPI002238A941|nr:fumarylacetoacetate hydrolase family protein [Streptomyces sp. SHP 1-2]MCW5253197.1 fumarylacetoacetate hydrolase family protein [Streptomyces sp. SHP 1-2]
MIPFALATRHRTAGGYEALLSIDGTLIDLVEAASPDDGARAALTEYGVQALLDDWERWLDRLTDVADAVRAQGVDDPRWHRGRLETGDTTLAPPVPQPRQVLCAASNYAKHVADFKGREDIDRFTGIDRSRMMPYLFAKGPDSPAGPYGEIAHPTVTSRLDYEVELAVALCGGGRRIPSDRAASRIAGYLLFNDLTCRDLQQRTDWAFFKTDWFAGKAFDGSALMGPLLVPARFVPDYRALELELKVNGEVRQQAPAGDMVFSIEEQIAFASAVTTLRPGDIIATGTPDGVAMKTGQWLQVGDLVEASGGPLGSHRHRVVNDPSADDGFRLAPPEAGR